MRTIALAAFLSVGLAAPGLAAEHGDRLDRLDIPTAEDSTLADCQAWLDQLGELIEEADPPVTEDVLATADERHDEVAQACEDGNYHEGIQIAADAIDMIEEEADLDNGADTAADDDS